MIVKTADSKTRRLASVAPSETLGIDSPGAAADYKSLSSLKDKEIHLGKRDYP